MNLRKKFSSQFIVLTLFLGVIIVGMMSGFIFQLKKYKEYKEEIYSLNEQIKETRLEIKEAEKAKSNKDLETMARERLNMVKPGEIIYIDIKEGN
ncbi:septum formation initiator family protein [Romboutsia sp. MSSM.1001216sp_RTP31141st1_G3_RTP31141_220114]|uniref:FtsB family cell division protein n=1 Tax=unclassified Romboutsia TaxID=2626894 RepID=UPI0031B61E5C